MEPIYVILIVLQLGIIAWFWMRAKKARTAERNTPPAPANVHDYESARAASLSITKEQLGLNIPDSVTRVYGVVMDWDMNGTLLTVSAYITGAANAFLSTGASATGSGGSPTVAEQASEFVLVAQDFLNRAMPVADLGFAPPGTVRFFLLTNRGIYAMQEMLSLINDNSSPLLGLFFRGHMLIEEIKASQALQN